jgi:signal transduction histidine kinase
VDLAALAREAAAAQPGADGRVAVLADAPVLVRGDAALLRVLVGNLVGNALRHSGPGTPVRVRVEARGRPELRVEDQGPGIPPEALGRVFDRFFRVESSGEDVPGAGLGLAIVAEVARLHGAEPRIDSTPSGTTVTVRF